MKRQFEKALKRRGFFEANWTQEISEVARKAMNEGELSNASSSLRAQVIERAARATAAKETIEKAEEFLNAAREIQPGVPVALTEALLLAARAQTANGVSASACAAVQDADEYRRLVGETCAANVSF